MGGENICKNPWKIYGGGKFVNKLTIKVQGKELWLNNILCNFVVDIDFITVNCYSRYGYIKKDFCLCA